MNPRSNLTALSLCALTLTSIFAVEVAGKGKNVTIDKKDQNPTIACTGNGVTVTGDDNHITLTGDCGKLTVKAKDININAATVKEVVVSGTDVNITVANVGKITVTGEDVNIIWGKGIDGKEPKITKKAKDVNIVHTGK